MNNLPENNNESQKNKRELIHAESFRSFSGPLPPPEILERFNDVGPGAAERIIKMAEEQFAHRVYLEKNVIGSDIERSNL